MSTCEPCWNEAYRQSRMLGGSQVDYYRALLDVIDGHPHTTPPAPESATPFPIVAEAPRMATMSDSPESATDPSACVEGEA